MVSLWKGLLLPTVAVGEFPWSHSWQRCYTSLFCAGYDIKNFCFAANPMRRKIHYHPLSLGEPLWRRCCRHLSRHPISKRFMHWCFNPSPSLWKFLRSQCWHYCHTFSGQKVCTTRSLGGPPGPDFQLAALRAGFVPFGTAWLLPSCLRHSGRVTHVNASVYDAVLFDDGRTNKQILGVGWWMVMKYPLRVIFMSIRSSEALICMNIWCFKRVSPTAVLALLPLFFWPESMYYGDEMPSHLTQLYSCL